MVTDWIAVCAPGRKLITTLNTLFWEENVIDVWEWPGIEGSAVVLIDANPYQELRERLAAMPLSFAPDRMPLRPEAHVRLAGAHHQQQPWRLVEDRLSSREREHG